jgi:hypothetical protein
MPEIPLEDQFTDALWSGLLPDCVRKCTTWFDFEKRELVILDSENEPECYRTAHGGSWLIIPTPLPVNDYSRLYGAAFQGYNGVTIVHDRYEMMLHEPDVDQEAYKRMREMVQVLACMPRLISGVPSSFKSLQGFLESQKMWNDAALVWNMRLMNLINWRLLTEKKASVELLVTS